MPLPIELEQEDDGRWLADVPALPGVIAYGATKEEAADAVQALGLRVLADRVEYGEAGPVTGAENSSCRLRETCKRLSGKSKNLGVLRGRHAETLVFSTFPDSL